MDKNAFKLGQYEAIASLAKDGELSGERIKEALIEIYNDTPIPF